MGFGFMLDSKWVFPIQSSFFTNSSSKQYSSSVRGKEASYESPRMSILSVIPEESEVLYKDSLKAYSSSFGSLQIIENQSGDKEEMKMKIGRGSHRTLYNPIDDTSVSIQDDTSTSYPRLQVNKTSRFSSLMENIEKIEEIFVDPDVVKLEKDILIQLGKLGAIKLFHVCLSRTLGLKEPTLSTPIPITELPRDSPINGPIDDKVGNIIVHSGRKKERKSRRDRALEKSSKISSLPSSFKTISKVPRRENPSNSMTRRLIIAKKESKMSIGVKEAANLERIRTSLEAETGRVISFSCWAEAAGVDEKVLQQRLHFGWYCRDKLLRSTRSLVFYIARNYRRLGISLEDLLQAGNVGVLQGAERFDHTRGYRFSTYIQYWIRKSMSTLVARHSRGIHIPVSLNSVMNQIRKARRSLYNIHGRYPNDDEISRFTGVSLAKIRLACKCPRIVGSIDQRMGDNLSIKFMEFTSDKSIKTPEEMVMTQHMRKDIYELLQGLQPRERQVLILRYGLQDGRSKSLEEIGKVFKCTKEWIRKIEKSALTKVRKEEVQRNLSHYLNF